MRRPILIPLLLAPLLIHCAGPTETPYRVASPPVPVAMEEVQLRIMETGKNADLDLARRVLAAFFDSRPAWPDEREDPPVGDLPAPEGCSWVALGTQAVCGFESPVGRLALCRTDDGVDLTLADFEQVVHQDVDGQSALRLTIRQDRVRDLERLTEELRSAVLLFIRAGQVSYAARVDGPLTGDVLLVGLEEQSGRAARGLLYGR